jgi:glycosyltransferase involved in cell wall biosynthesis
VSGFLVPVGETAALAAQLRELATTPAIARSLGQAGALDVRRRFASETMADAVDALYRRLLDES